MAITAEVKAKTNQVSPAVFDEGDFEDIIQSRIGQVYTADWKERLLFAGRIFRFDVGTISDGAPITQIQGGGAGTTIEIELPEIIVGVSSGQSLIPIEIDVQVESDTDFPSDMMNIIAFADRTQAAPTSLTGTIETPVNLLDGGPSFNGRAYSAVISADISVPVMSELLQYRRRTQIEMVLNGSATNLTASVDATLHLHYEPKAPSLLAGPCSIVVCWGGTVAVTGIATIVFAAVPSTWFPTS